jgi:hypothetical protein
MSTYDLMKRVPGKNLIDYECDGPFAEAAMAAQHLLEDDDSATCIYVEGDDFAAFVMRSKRIKK